MKDEAEGRPSVEEQMARIEREEPAEQRLQREALRRGGSRAKKGDGQAHLNRVLALLAERGPLATKELLAELGITHHQFYLAVYSVRGQRVVEAGPPGAGDRVVKTNGRSQQLWRLTGKE